MTLNEYKTYFENNIVKNPDWDSVEPVMLDFFKDPHEPELEFTEAIVEANIPEDFRNILMQYVLGLYMIQPFMLSPKAFDYVANNCDSQMDFMKQRFEAEEEKWQTAIHAPPAQQHMYFNHMGLTDPQIEIDRFSYCLLHLATPEQRLFAKMKWGMFELRLK